MDSGIQVAAAVVVFAGFAMVVAYQRWRRTSQTQIDIDTRFEDDDDSVD